MYMYIYTYIHTECMYACIGKCVVDGCIYVYTYICMNLDCRMITDYFPPCILQVEQQRKVPLTPVPAGRCWAASLLGVLKKMENPRTKRPNSKKRRKKSTRRLLSYSIPKPWAACRTSRLSSTAAFVSSRQSMRRLSRQKRALDGWAEDPIRCLTPSK